MPKEELLKTWVARDLYRDFARLAERNERSLAAQLRVAIKEQLDRETSISEAVSR